MKHKKIERKENPRCLYYAAKVDEIEHWEDRKGIISKI